MNNKYSLTQEGHLYRLTALKDFGLVKKGDKGGLIESQNNLDILGDAWVSGDARVFGDARVSGDARVLTTALIASRSDGYTFLICKDKDNILRIIAGCRYFTIAEAVKHWKTTRKNTQLGEESLQIVKHLKKMAEITGL